MALDIVINIRMTSCKVALLLSGCNVTFQEIPTNRRRVVPCGRTDGQTQTDETTLIFSFCNVEKATEH
jgi:hypothetical protein